MTRRDRNPIHKAAAIIIACLAAILMIAVEYTLLPRFAALWTVLIVVLAAAIAFCSIVAVREWKDRRTGI